jgi:hypothetical protein
VGGAVVDVELYSALVSMINSHAVTTSTTTGEISPVNGRLTIPSLTSGVPTEAEILAEAGCPNRNWTPQVEPRSIELVPSVYTFTFEGFTAPYITIIDP